MGIGDDQAIRVKDGACPSAEPAVAYLNQAAAGIVYHGRHFAVELLQYV
jgi:hypothetical protein